MSHQTLPAGKNCQTHCEGVATSSQHFTLRSLTEGRIYTFSLWNGPPFKSPIFARTDNCNIKVVFDDDFGWIVRNLNNPSELLGRPWDTPFAQQDSRYPPEGIWVSRKGPKSYVYEMKLN